MLVWFGPTAHIYHDRQRTSERPRVRSRRTKSASVRHALDRGLVGLVSLVGALSAHVVSGYKVNSHSDKIQDGHIREINISITLTIMAPAVAASSVEAATNGAPVRAPIAPTQVQQGEEQPSNPSRHDIAAALEHLSTNGSRDTTGAVDDERVYRVRIELCKFVMQCAANLLLDQVRSGVS